MFQNLYNKFYPPKIKINLKRDLPINYFIHKEYHNEIRDKGFVVIKNVVSNNELEKLQSIFNKLESFTEYSIHDKFQNSGRFRSTEIRNFVMQNIELFSKDFLPVVFNKETYDNNTTGAFQIKPPSKVSELNPHQDAPVIDETKCNGLFVWIPLCDITDQNGAVCVLPGSHKWGNYQRSLNVPWAFEKHTKLLWKYMQSVYMKKGDLLCWDSALIHASSPNLSNETRVAITTTILPRNFKMVEFFKDNTTPKDSVEKYEVERSFWEKEDIMKRPPCPPNKFIGFEELNFNKKISKSELIELINN